MNEIDSAVQVSSTLRTATPKQSPVLSSQRLVVMIREAEEEGAVANRILSLAEPRGLSILLVGIAPDPANEAGLRRELVTIAAFLNERGPQTAAMRVASAAKPVEIQVKRGRDWLASVRSLVRPGDTIACFADDAVGLLERPLSDTLASALNMPIYTFTGLRAQQRNRQNVVAQAASWVSSIVSIAGFFALQARIVVEVQGTLQSVLLLVTVLAEVGIIWGLNSLFGQS